MEKLRTYLSRENLHQAVFGAMIGLSQAAVSRYVRGVRFPEPEVILKIERATNGYITPCDWYANLPRPELVDSVGAGSRPSRGVGGVGDCVDCGGSDAGGVSGDGGGGVVCGGDMSEARSVEG